MLPSDKLLALINAGKTEFGPESSSREDLIRFQETALLLLRLHQEGKISYLKEHVDEDAEEVLIDRIIVQI